MELVVLNDDFRPVKLVENYESLIWTERYSSNGDFQLRTPAVQSTLNLLYNQANPKKEVVVSLRESLVPMRCEVFKIEKPGGIPFLTVSGTSYDTVLSQRAGIVDPDPNKNFIKDAGKGSDAAYRAIRIVIGDPENRFDGLTLVLPAVDPLEPLDILSRVDLPLPEDYEIPPWYLSTNEYTIGDAVRFNFSAPDPENPNPRTFLAKKPVPSGAGNDPETNTDDRWIESKFEVNKTNLYTAVRELLALNFHGLQASRPLVSNPDNKVKIEVINGRNLTSQLVVDARFDQFDNATYLLSQQGSANIAYVFKGTDRENVNKTQVLSEPSDIERRVIYVDGSQDAATDLRSKGLIELYKYNATAIFDGEVAQQIGKDYQKKYRLGDIIRLQGEYGLYRNVRVSEFIRSEDSSGEKAYPAFEVVEDV